MNEFEIQALIEYTFRRNGADRPSFATIVGSGPNSTTLHYNRRRPVHRASNDVVVMDIGASYKGYAADVTRTVPASGTFSHAQRDDLPDRARRAGGGRASGEARRASRLMNDSATAVLAAGLARLGLIESPDATYDCGVGRQRRGSVRSTAVLHARPRARHRARGARPRAVLLHGSDRAGQRVHDRARHLRARARARGDARHAAQPRDRRRSCAQRRERYKNIGVRIEDDYVATDTRRRMDLAARRARSPRSRR